MTDVAFDTSVLLTWVLQEPTWQRVDALLRNSQVTPVLAGPTLTELVHLARRKGNRSSPDMLLSAFLAHGAVIELSGTDDLLRAAELRETSDAHPGPHGETLSLGDAMILAVVERLEIAVVTRDTYWAEFAGHGHTSARVHDYVKVSSGT